MKYGTLSDPQNLLKALCLFVLIFLPINVFFTPLFDFLTVADRMVSWTVTLSAFFFLLPFSLFFAVSIAFLKTRNEKLVFLFFAIFLVYAFALTISLAETLVYPFFGLISLACAVIVGLLFYVSARDGAVSSKTVFAFLLTAAAFSVMPVLLVHLDIDAYARLADEFGPNRILYAFEHPRALGWLSTFGLCLLAAYVATQPKGTNVSKTLLFLAVVTSTTLFWSGSRGGVVAITLGFLTVFAFSRTKNYRGLAAILVCIVLGALASSFLHAPGPSFGIFARLSQTLEAESLSRATSNRSEIWPVIVSYIRDSPLVGYGYLPHRRLEGLHSASAHNIILEFWLGFGVVIGTAVLAFGVALWVLALGFFRRANDPYVSALFCVVTTFFAYCLVSGPYARTFPLIIFAVSFGTILGLRSAQANAPST